MAHELLYLDSDGSPIYSDHFSRLNGDILSRAGTLCPHHDSTDEEEARLCLPLPMGYNATIYNNGGRGARIQQILSRCWEVLDRLPASLLGVQFLTYCCDEVFDDDLFRETHSIIDNQGKHTLSGDECEVAEQPHNPEKSPYPNWEVEE